MEKTVMVVPLFSGSGIRIKIIEGMSMGIPIISTPKGAQGIPYTNGKNILICKNSIEFKKAIENIQKDENLFNQISQGGKDLVKSYFSTNVVLNNWKKLLYETSYHNTQNPRSIR